MPRIGLTSTETPGVPYVRAIERAGGTVVALANDAGELEVTLAALDGIVVSGGVDIDPCRYGGRAEHARCERDEYRADRDAFEIALVRAARERGIPLLGICRGMQVANVAFGGSLVEDLHEEFGDRYTIEHRQVDETGLERYEYAERHTVTLLAGSALARLVGSMAFPTNSMHHQAVRRTGDGLVAVGQTDDGVIEALDATFEHPFFFAVQWHPEELDDAISAALFGGLVAAAEARSLVRSGAPGSR